MNIDTATLLTYDILLEERFSLWYGRDAQYRLFRGGITQTCVEELSNMLYVAKRGSE